MKACRWFVMFTLFLLLLSACDGQNEVDSESANPAANDTPVPGNEEVKEQDKVRDEQPVKQTYPLTGEPTNDNINQRVISVMVNNHMKARPQKGLSQADLVYEVLAEGQITRFLALFHSEIPDTEVGPVRSARPYYLELAKGFQALFVHHGASPEAYQQIRNSQVSIDGMTYDNNGWLFDRSSERPAPHNSYLLTGGLDQVIAQKGYSSEEMIAPLPFSNEGVEGNPANKVTITYSAQPEEIVSFKYDPDREQFLRFSDGEPTVDRATDERIAVDNVWIIEADHKVIDSAGRRKIDLTSGGRGYLIQKGRLLEVEWENHSGRILPFKDGDPLTFIPGKTWINVVPKDAGIEPAYSGK